MLSNIPRNSDLFLFSTLILEASLTGKEDGSGHRSKIVSTWNN